MAMVPTARIRANNVYRLLFTATLEGISARLVPQYIGQQRTVNHKMLCTTAVNRRAKAVEDLLSKCLRIGKGLP
ncbi:MAG: hypothetical protein PVF93_12590, partial [Chromatiaceae bacterium]